MAPKCCPLRDARQLSPCCVRQAIRIVAGCSVLFECRSVAVVRMCRRLESPETSRYSGNKGHHRSKGDVANMADRKELSLPKLYDRGDSSPHLNFEPLSGSERCVILLFNLSLNVCHYGANSHPFFFLLLRVGRIHAQVLFLKN